MSPARRVEPGEEPPRGGLEPREEGGIAAIVGSFKGLHTKGGPKGVGQAVNESVVLTFLFLFTLNYLITTIYFQVVPQGAR